MIRRLSDIKDEEALDVIADLLEPIVVICQNKELVKAVRSNKNKLKIAQIAIRANKKEVMEILSILSDEKEYHCSAISILNDAKTLFGDQELIDFFTSQVLTEEQTSSASASENTEAKEE